jgi:hypothetical protein
VVDETTPPEMAGEVDTPESLFGTAQDTEATAPAPPAEKEPAKRGRKPIGDRPMTRKEIIDRSRAKTKSAADKKSRSVKSAEEISKKEARLILTEERGIQNLHVADTCVELAAIAARHYGITYNAHLFVYGLRKTLAALDGAKVTLPEAEPKLIEGEVIHSTDAWALWDYSMFREDTGYAEFLRLRRVIKSDPFLLGRDILGRDYHEKPHGAWREFFPKFSPIGLKPLYSQEAFKKWLGEQDPVKSFNLVASRNAYKSHYAITSMVSAITCCADLKILICTEEKSLSRGFLRGLRSHFEVTNEQQPTRFQQLVPEYCIKPDDGSSLILQCPMAHLDIIENSVTATSMDSSAAGRRCSWLHLDDPISNLTVGNDIQRQLSVEKYDLLTKLVEPGGYVTMCSTPWHVADLTAELIRRCDESEEGTAKYKIDPAWTVKPEAALKRVEDLEASDVELLFESRLSFKYLRGELRKSAKNNYRLFRMQHLCEFVQEGEDTPVLRFDQNMLLSACRPSSDIPQGEIFFSVDLSYSLSAKADLISCSVLKVYHNDHREMCVAVMDIETGRMRMNDLGQLLATMCRRWNPRLVIIEDGPLTDSLGTALRMAGVRYGISIPVKWVKPSNKRQAKLLRIVDAATLVEQGRMVFAHGDYSAGLFEEAARLDESTNINSKKCDRWDSIAQLCVCLKIVSTPPGGVEDPESQENELAQFNRQEMNRQMYNAMFSGPNPLDMPAQKQEESPPQPRRNVAGGVAGRFATLPSNFRQGKRT